MIGSTRFDPDSLAFWEIEYAVIEAMIVLIGIGCLITIVVGLAVGWAGPPIIEHLLRGDPSLNSPCVAADEMF